MAYLFEELITDKRLLVNARIPEAFWQIFRMLNGEDIQRITLSGLAQQFHMSPTYISNRFKHYFGISPIAMKNRILFERSKLMLTDRDMTISDRRGDRIRKYYRFYSLFFTEGWSEPQ